MKSAHKKTEDGLINKYKSNLESRIEKGDQSLVCRDEELCKEVKMLLRNGSAQKIHNLHGLDSLAVMEKSLSAFVSKTGQMRLEKLSKAFEVLELAALNLYIYPWRKEYRLVKMFSGMFTHSIKPALTLQQAKELFGLLGYQASSLKGDEELELNSKLVPADFLLGFACGFFTARMECQLLLSAMGSADKDVEWALQLVKERQAGLSVQVALENTKRKSGAASVSDAILAGDMDTELDLYTEQADTSHMTSTSGSPPHTYIPPKESDLSKPLQKEPLSYIGNNEYARQGGPLNSPGPIESFAKDQTEADAQRQAAAKMLCKCIRLDQLYIYQCENCKDIHTPICIHYKECRNKGHALALSPYKVEDLFSTHDQLSSSKEKSKDSLKKHHCMINSTSDSFLVCHDCQLIHEHNCNSVKACKYHIVQSTGKVQPPQGESANTQKRHKCLSSGAPVYVICHTCNNSHDFLCKDGQNCISYAHCIQHPQEMGDSETPCTPKPYHHCCIKPWPEIVCLTCNVFHASRCLDVWQCSKEHKIKELGTKCIDCCSSELNMLCRYCGALYCKDCWFKSPLSCKCGKLFNHSSSV